jgi:hypothetical protein
MVELKEEGRRAPRKRTLKGARIVFNNRRSAIDCTVRNVSAHGALLLLPSIAGVPNEFELWTDGTCHTARIVWKGAGKIGVSWG